MSLEIDKILKNGMVSSDDPSDKFMQLREKVCAIETDIQAHSVTIDRVRSDHSYVNEEIRGMRSEFFEGVEMLERVVHSVILEAGGELSDYASDLRDESKANSADLRLLHDNVQSIRKELRELKRDTHSRDSHAKSIRASEFEFPIEKLRSNVLSQLSAYDGEIQGTFSKFKAMIKTIQHEAQIQSAVIAERKMELEELYDMFSEYKEKDSSERITSSMIRGDMQAMVQQYVSELDSSRRRIDDVERSFSEGSRVIDMLRKKQLTMHQELSKNTSKLASIHEKHQRVARTLSQEKHELGKLLKEGGMRVEMFEREARETVAMKFVQMEEELEMTRDECRKKKQLTMHQELSKNTSKLASIHEKHQRVARTLSQEKHELGKLLKEGGMRVEMFEREARETVAMKFVQMEEELEMTRDECRKSIMQEQTLRMEAEGERDKLRQRVAELEKEVASARAEEATQAENKKLKSMVTMTTKSMEEMQSKYKGEVADLRKDILVLTSKLEKAVQRVLFLRKEINQSRERGIDESIELRKEQLSVIKQNKIMLGKAMFAQKELSSLTETYKKLTRDKDRLVMELREEKGYSRMLNAQLTRLKGEIRIKEAMDGAARQRAQAEEVEMDMIRESRIG
ncbi:hypothetical protein ADUPG1_000033 [Aduncisulcus paluster]|uniref:Uncharacterized protein n=1 Tax=Aduncisulcus paluster TaxID=2918883 RepID=A0ABQ5K653_9EUKA|nr:hypothetical protein ADUPG1_000033 [Aduncisulcus paluster]